MYKELINRLKSVSATKYTIQEAEKLANEVLKTFGCTDNDTLIPIVKIVNAFHLKACKVSNFPEDVSGSVFIGGTTRKIYNADKVIIVKDGEPLSDQRIIVAYGLAHYLFYYIRDKKYNNPNRLFQKIYVKKEHDSWGDILEDHFVAELLLPKKAFLSEYTKVMEITDYDKVYAISYLAKIFMIDEINVLKRIQEVIG